MQSESCELDLNFLLAYVDVLMDKGLNLSWLVAYVLVYKGIVCAFESNWVKVDLKVPWVAMLFKFSPFISWNHTAFKSTDMQKY